jgi:adenosylmethionine-8-amino-7-oxononanoate aminotransferase
MPPWTLPPHRPAASLSPFAPRGPRADLAALEAADRRHVWKPFTQMAGYVKDRPIVVEEGLGNWLRDAAGREYLDGVSSLWVNLHGHRHPRIVAALRDQLDRLDHSTMLGPTNVPAVQLAERLIGIAPGDRLSRVFYSDNGSTAVEIAVKMAFQVHAQHRDPRQRERDVFVTLTNAYHGDTIGSVAVGGIDLFHQLYEPLLFETVKAPAPDPFHRAFGRDPAEHEAECLAALEAIFDAHEGRVAALVMEPLMQGAAGMIRHSVPWLRAAAALARERGALVVLDEVATGFGRSGRMFASDVAGVAPDLLCVAKGITGGVLPLAATLASEAVYEGFLGEQTEYRTFFHGHSYTGNPLACAAALASLDVFEEEGTLARLEGTIARLGRHLDAFAEHPHVGDVRRLGVMTGIELVADRATGRPFEPGRAVGQEVIRRAAERGVLVRPLGDVVVLMPPLSITDEELDLLCGVVFEAIDEATRAP